MINKRLLFLVPGSLNYILLVVLLKFLSLIASIAMIYTVAEIISSEKNINFAEYLVIILSILLNAICLRLSSKFSFLASRNVKYTLRKLIYEKILRLGSDYQEKIETAKLIQFAVEGVEQLEVWFGSYLPQFFYSIIASIATFFVLSFINMKMALILLGCVPLIPISIVCVQKIAKRLLSNYWKEYGNLADNFLENLQGLTTLIMYKADDFKQKKMQEEAENFRKITMKVLSMQLNSIIIMDLIAYGGAALGITAGIYAFQNNLIDMKDCIVSILISADFFIPLRRLGSCFHTAMNGMTASKNIFEFLDLLEKKDGTENIQDDKNSSLIFECSETGYSYGSKKILKNCNAGIKRGSFTVFSGKSGSGKSTFAKILSGINRNYSGSVKIFGKELKTIKLAELYKNVSYISHRDWIFKGSVKETLLEGKCNASDEEMWEALDKVQLSEFLKTKNGLETEIMENATNLSGGQKQRLSIARALLHDTKIIVFDEAASNIDVESEKAIVELLHQLKKNKTIIMISHRTENYRDADKIYYFSDGIISEEKNMEVAN